MFRCQLNLGNNLICHPVVFLHWEIIVDDVLRPTPPRRRIGPAARTATGASPGPPAPPPTSLRPTPGPRPAGGLQRRQLQVEGKVFVEARWLTLYFCSLNSKLLFWVHQGFHDSDDSGPGTIFGSILVRFKLSRPSVVNSSTFYNLTCLCLLGNLCMQQNT